jgi:3-hydroxyacyl-[acyl-carrier-protein] dehydratase
LAAGAGHGGKSHFAGAASSSRCAERGRRQIDRVDRGRLPVPAKELILDFSEYDPDRVIADIEEIRRYNMQRFEMEQLSAVVFVDLERAICAGYKDVSEKDFWVRGHMPGIPLMPGVVICEAAAQLSSFFARKYNLLGCPLVGLGGLEEVRFRGAVVPGDRLLVVVERLKVRRGAAILCHFQGFVKQAMVVEGKIMGVCLPFDVAGNSSSQAGQSATASSASG